MTIQYDRTQVPTGHHVVNISLGLCSNAGLLSVSEVRVIFSSSHYQGKSGTVTMCMKYSGIHFFCMKMYRAYDIMYCDVCVCVWMGVLFCLAQYM